MTEYKKILTPKDAAKRLGVSVRTLADWRYDGKGPDYYRVGEGALTSSGRCLDRVVYTEDDITHYAVATNRAIPS